MKGRIRFGGSRRVNYNSQASPFWWARCGRQEKLAHIMLKYNDAEKAARVIGCTPAQAIAWWRAMQSPEFQKRYGEPKMLTPKPRLIALHSPVPGSGKSTLAVKLSAERAFARVSFGAPIKAMTEALLHSASLGWSPHEVKRRVYGDKEAKEEEIPGLGITSRFIQQTIGTEWARDCIRESFWVDIALGAAARHMKNGRSVVIDDMRFPNEYDAVLAAGGDAYRICRPDAAMTTPAHRSEGQLDNIHMPEIWNTGTLPEFFAAAERVLFAA